MTNKINNKDQHNCAVEYEPKFVSGFSSSGGAKDLRTVITVSLPGGKKHRVYIISGLTYICDGGATDSIIKR